MISEIPQVYRWGLFYDTGCGLAVRGWQLYFEHDGRGLSNNMVGDIDGPYSELTPVKNAQLCPAKEISE